MHTINRFLRKLSALQWKEQQMLEGWDVRKANYIGPGNYEWENQQEPEAFKLDPLHSVQGTTYFMKKELDIPIYWEGHSYGLIVDAGGCGEGMLRVNGTPHHGIDKNHSYVPLHFAEIGTQPLIEIELYDPIPEPHDPLNGQATIAPPIPYIRLKLVLVDEPIQQLLFSARVASQSAFQLPEEDARRVRIVAALHQLKDQVESLLEEQTSRVVTEDIHATKQSFKEQIERMEQELLEIVEQTDLPAALRGKMHMVGQSHIDIAWLWPVRETVRKVSRTFSTMNTLMREYPEFTYSQSQPLLYAFAKEHYPELYEQIKARVAEGRWELVGGMWVEPDLNIPSGESLVRQILYGQQFYQEEFGKKSHIEWLPDTFGYCASLPQLLKLSGVEFFMTTKLNWNDTNVFPYDLFRWVGIDGTSVTSYLNHGLNEDTVPKDIREHWDSYRQKDKLDEQMLLYGHGDGGGGVTRDMVENIRRAPYMTGLPESRFSTATAFFDQVREVEEELPAWHGDLYLELHRGTYTTHARNKRSNRKAEALYREAEIWMTIASSYLDVSKQQELKVKLADGWKLIMLNQFHDIIPGTAITESYVTSAAEYEHIFQYGYEVLEEALTVLTKHADVDKQQIGKPYLVFNSLGWSRREVIHLELDQAEGDVTAYDNEGNVLASNWTVDEKYTSGKRTLSVTTGEIPAFGHTTVWLRPAMEHSSQPIEDSVTKGITAIDFWETAYYRLEFNEAGEITSWYDKAAEREIVKPGHVMNEWQLFGDKPLLWDAWDIDPNYEQKRADPAVLLQSEVVLQGATSDILRFTWQLHESTLKQDIIFYHHEKRVDFKTWVDWKEEHKLLKVAFPVDLVADKATYEIPFGALERVTHANTSWEQAQYEVCGHRFADLSEHGYGVSLLNDCKYGYDIKEGTLRLSLLRAPRWPDKTADQGEHEFTYSLLPHEGDWRTAHTVRSAAELNQPVQAILVDVAESPIDAGATTPEQFIELDAKQVVLDTVKVAENGDGIILRFYESSGSRETIRVAMKSGISRAVVVNLLEEEVYELEARDGVIQLDFKPYQIVSVKLNR
ncbi:glycoside hydrolase family 38 C-terminal domain-containing protein [Paenibacillus sp. Marseille-Q4541]|uniref:alpha-mannosidase n=1 Tax=Paenibacillus sp. Marseille-Q4541 TaxID=2831522 RepID=UPI001BA75FFE|nr:glycoside hydrolase family 38 C-terminal domain-containing protein [Paenibacillus sp. Marseille-Q4541]